MLGRQQTLRGSAILTRKSYSDLSRLYKSSTLKKIAKGDCSFLNSVLKSSDINAHLPTSPTVEEVYQTIYGFISEDYRCEYYFKNEIANRLFLGLHSHKDASIYFEKRVGGRIADVVIVNGMSTVYEIKTNLDTFSRLSDQINCFTKVFDRAYVVLDDGAAKDASSHIVESVGLIEIDGDGNIVEIRKSASHTHLFCSETAFKTLSRNEYMPMIEGEFGSVPDVASWEVFEACMEMFLSLPREKAYNLYLGAIRQSKHHNRQYEVATKSTPALTAVLLDAKLSAGDWERVPCVLASPVE